MRKQVRPILMVFALFASAIGCQEETPIQLDGEVAEVACAMCQFDMGGSTCDLAVRIDGKTYYVDGAGEELHEHAHDEGGTCMTVREAKITGMVENGRFKASSLELVPLEEKADEDGDADEKAGEKADEESKD